MFLDVAGGLVALYHIHGGTCALFDQWLYGCMHCISLLASGLLRDLNYWLARRVSQLWHRDMSSV